MPKTIQKVQRKRSNRKNSRKMLSGSDNRIQNENQRGGMKALKIAASSAASSASSMATRVIGGTLYPNALFPLVDKIDDNKGKFLDYLNEQLQLEPATAGAGVTHTAKTKSDLFNLVIRFSTKARIHPTTFINYGSACKYLTLLFADDSKTFKLSKFNAQAKGLSELVGIATNIQHLFDSLDAVKVIRDEFNTFQDTKEKNGNYTKNTEFQNILRDKLQRLAKGGSVNVPCDAAGAPREYGCTRSVASWGKSTVEWGEAEIQSRLDLLQREIKAVDQAIDDKRVDMGLDKFMESTAVRAEEPGEDEGTLAEPLKKYNKSMEAIANSLQYSAAVVADMVGGRRRRRKSSKKKSKRKSSKKKSRRKSRRKVSRRKSRRKSSKKKSSKKKSRRRSRK